MTPADALDPVGRLREWANAMPEHWVILGHGGTSMPVADLRAVLRRLEDGEAMFGAIVGALRAIDAALGVDPMHCSSPEDELSSIARLTKDAERYRALRLGLIAYVGEEGELGIGCTVASSEQDNTEEPLTELEAPFLTADERAELNGTKPHGKGYLRGDNVIDRIADFVVAETHPAAAPRPDAGGAG